MPAAERYPLHWPDGQPRTPLDRPRMRLPCRRCARLVLFTWYSMPGPKAVHTGAVSTTMVSEPHLRPDGTLCESELNDALERAKAELG